MRAKPSAAVHRLGRRLARPDRAPAVVVLGPEPTVSHTAIPNVPIKKTIRFI